MNTYLFILHIYLNQLTFARSLEPDPAGTVRNRQKIILLCHTSLMG